MRSYENERAQSFMEFQNIIEELLHENATLKRLLGSAGLGAKCPDEDLTDVLNWSNAYVQSTLAQSHNAWLTKTPPTISQEEVSFYLGS